MSKFIKDNREEIDLAMKTYAGRWDKTPKPHVKRNDKERYEFVINDEDWYFQAKGAGVKT